MRHSVVSRLVASVPRAALLAAALAVPGRDGRAQFAPVYRDDPSWLASLGGAGTARITADAPRSGNGSLALTVEGGDTDWAFYRHAAGDPLTSSFGLLADVDRLGFDWRRSSADFAPVDAPWRAQTPVLRLYVREELGAGTQRFSELVWERYYTTPAQTPLDTWQTEELTGQGFWRVVFSDAGRGYTRHGCAEGPLDPRFPLLALAPTSWTGGLGCFDAANTFVWALGVGLGSSWPRPYTGFVDNVHLGFATDGREVVAANFELRPNEVGSVVPEPATIGLVALGLAGLAAAARTRRRR